jgi:hypothetical protein
MLPNDFPEKQVWLYIIYILYIYIFIYICKYFFYTDLFIFKIGFMLTIIFRYVD